MFAWVTTDKDENDEGIIGFRFGDQWMPLVGADKARIQSLKAQALAVATSTGKPVKLIHFSVREELEIITPINPQNKT